MTTEFVNDPQEQKPQLSLVKQFDAAQAAAARARAQHVANTLPRGYPQDRPLWHRWPNEPMLWYKRFVTFMQLGPKRTVQKCQEHCNSKSSLFINNSLSWHWKERAIAFDDSNAEIEFERQSAIMSTGLALPGDRVLVLKEIAEREARLAKRTLDLMDEDTEGSRSPLNRRYEVIRNALGATLADIAAETGGRVKRISLEKELDQYAIALAKEQGYDIETAKKVARLVVIEGESKLLE